jgi:L-lactate dehydrogenase complex protein LldG
VIDTFIAALEAEGGRGARVADVPEARAYARELLGDDAALCFWSGDPLVTSLDPASLGRVTDPADAAAGITGADFGIAATGTLVLTYGTGRWRTTGLLPDLHIAVLYAERIVATLDEAVARVYAGDAPRAMTLVTGASATSDIEKIRVVGAHGPRMVAAIVVG